MNMSASIRVNISMRVFWISTNVVNEENVFQVSEVSHVLVWVWITQNVIGDNDRGLVFVITWNPLDEWALD